MKKSEVSLIITTSTLTLSEISSRLGRTHSPGSHQKGAHRHTGPPFERTIWRLDSAADPVEPLERHCESIAYQLPPEALRRAGILPDDAEVYIDIAVYFDTPMCTLSIPVACVTIAMKYVADIEVSCYPSDFESE